MFFPWVLKFAVQGYIVCMYLHICIMLLHVNKLQLEVHSLCGIHVYRPRAIYLLWSLEHLFMMLVIILFLI